MDKSKIKVNTFATGYKAKRKSTTDKVNTFASAYRAKHNNNGSILGYSAANVGIGLAGMFEGISDFVAGSFYQLIGDKDYAKYLHMNDVTGGWKERLDKNFNPSSTVKVIGDISGALGQALPSVAIGVATGGASVAAQVAGGAALGASYAGRGITSAVQQTGQLGGKENVYGVLSGSLEGVTDMFLGGTVKAGKALITTTRQAAKVGAKKIARNTVLKGMLSSATSEAAEEFIQEYADTALLRLTGVNKEAEYSFENAAYSALIGGITGGFLGGITNGINTGVNLKIGQDLQQRGLAEQVLNTADYVRDVHIGNSKNYSNITSESLRALTASVDAYRGLNAEAKAGTKGAVILGEIKQELLAFETSAGVDAKKVDMQSSDADTRAKLAKVASDLYGKEVSAEDIAKNSGDVTHRLALEDFVRGVLSESSMESAARERAEAITAERIPYIKSAASWSNESAAYRDPKSGRYVFVEPNSEDGTWRMGFSPTAIYDENNIMVKEGISTEDVKKTLSGLADGSLEIGAKDIRPVTDTAVADPNAVPTFKNNKAGRKAKKDYKRALREQERVGNTSVGDVQSDVNVATAEDEVASSPAVDEAQNGAESDGSVESGQESARSAKSAAEAEYAAKKPTEMTENERKRGYTDKEANTARSFVRDFDVMPREKRLAIIEMIRSGEDCGASKSFMKHAAAMIGYWRSGLHIIADKDSLERGFYQTFGDGSRLIVVNPVKTKGSDKHAIDLSFVHELAHDIWTKATKRTKDELYRLATEGATAAEVEDIRAELKRAYDARGLKLDEEVIREEIFTELISKTLGNENFLERFDATPGRMTAFTRGAKAALRMAKCFVGKDRYLHRQTEKMTRAFIRAMGEEMVSEVLAGGETRYSIEATDDNRPVVVVNDDITRYASNDKELVKLVKKSISKTKYVAINKQKIYFVDDTKKEVTYSEYTKKLRRKSPNIYHDKMRLFNHPSEIILATTNYINEAPNHQRKDDIIDFARGEILIDVQGRKYSADVLIGFTDKGICELHDIVKMKSASFQYKTRHALRTISSSDEHFQTGTRLVDNSIPQNSEKSTPSAKKIHAFSEEETKEIQNSFANAEKEKAKAANKSKSKSKSKTEAELKAENNSLKKQARHQKKENEKLFDAFAESRRKISKLKGQKQALETEVGDRVRVAKLVKEVAAAVDFFKNEVMHRKYTSGGTVGATILADPGIRAFAEFFAKKSSAYNIMNKSTRVAFQLLGEFYNPQNPIFAEENNAAAFFGEDSKNFFSSYRPEVAEMIDAIANGEGDLKASELRDFSDILKNVRHIYENYDGVRRQGKSESAKVLAAKDYYAQIEARSVLEDESGGKPKLKRFFQIVKESYLYTVVTPEEVLRDLECHVKDPILSTLYREIRLGEAKAGKIRAEILTPITEFLADKENKEFFKNLKKPTVSFGGATITTAQAVGIYTTSKRKHAQDRMYDPDNGIRIFDHESKRNEVIKVEKSMVDKLYASFDATTREYIRLLEEAMVACKKYKVDTDIDVMGFTNAIDGYYYPITTDKTYFVKDITDVRQSMDVGEVVKDKGFNKNTVQGAQAPLFIEDAQVVLERHVGGISQYAGLYIPLQNFGKVYGAKIDPTISAEEQGRINDADKLKEAMKLVKKTSLREYYNANVWNDDGKNNGKNLDSYLTKLFADIQRIKPGDVSIIDKGVEALRSGYVNSVFGLNPKIIMTQLASYPAAYRIIDTDCLAGAFGRNPLSKENQEAMDKYSLITLSRKFEGANAADGLIEKLSEVGKKTSAGIEYTDRSTISFLYSACQLQIEKDGGAAVGTEENLEAAAALLDNVLLDTQSTSLLSDRSALARDKNEFAKLLSMFRNEAVKAFSNFYGAISSYHDHKRLGEKDGSYNELLEADKKRISRNAVSYLGSSAWVAVISIAFSKLYGLGKDDEEKERLAVTLAKEGASAVFDLFPIISDVAGFMMDGYDLNSIPLEVLNDLLTGIRGVGTLVDPEATSMEKAKYIRNTAYTVSNVFGLPVKNADKLARTTVAIFNKPLSYRLTNKSDTAPSYKSDLERALEKGNGRLAQTIMTLWMDDKITGEASVATVNELTRLYSVKGAEGKSIFSMPRNVPASLTKKEKEHFKTVYAGADAAMLSLLSSKAYTGLDDSGKAAAVKACYDLYYVKAQAACGLEISESGARISAAVGKLDPNILYAVMGYAKTLSGDGKKDMIIKYLSSLGIPQKARDAYLEALGYKT